MMFFLLHFLRFSVGFEIGTVAAIVFSTENEAAFQACAGDCRDKKKRDKASEAAHEV
jgi:hypothetical protein